MNRRKLGFLAVSLTLMITLLAGGLFGQAVSRDNVYRYLSIFTEVFSLVRSSYVENVDPDELIAGAFDGLTDAIDEYSYYVPPTRMEAYRDYREPETTGPGIVVSRRFGYAYVIAPLAGSPAKAAGIEAGDFIEMIDGDRTQEMALWEIRSALHGEKGSKVSLVLLKGSMNKRETIEVERKNFAIPAPVFTTVDGVGYIAIPFFSEQTPEQLASALEAAAAAGARKLIVDVRGNADGAIEPAIESADLLLGKGTIASLEGRRVDARTWSADPETVYDGELVVLADSSSTGGAEVFAAAIRDNERGRVVGTRTYGKAIEQRLVHLPSGGALMVTIGDYTTPKSQVIRQEGVRPDVVVDLTPLIILGEEDDSAEKPDLILDRAIAILKSSEVEKKAA
ncbi:MAG TPA: S41 family peptidase [Thermoanaerobaculia bacterium]|nr:S41 family peptidase [Thermoanaerobaculia bacterium]